jgi:hypothetical protein
MQASKQAAISLADLGITKKQSQEKGAASRHLSKLATHF